MSASEKIIAIWWALTDIIDDATRTWRLNKENVSSRAHIAFRTEELVARVSRECDGHVFIVTAGLSFRHVFWVLGLK